MVAIETNVYLHGGMAGTSVFDDMYKLNTVTYTWTSLSPTGDVPEARTAHAATAVKQNLFVFGGMSGIGSALDDFYMLNTGKNKNSQYLKINCSLNLVHIFKCILKCYFQ